MQTYDIDSSMVKIYEEDQKISGQNYIPSVIEPSFGIGRIMYCVLEHNFYSRAEVQDDQAKQENGKKDKKAAEPEKRTVFRYEYPVNEKVADIFY